MDGFEAPTFQRLAVGRVDPTVAHFATGLLLANLWMLTGPITVWIEGSWLHSDPLMDLGTVLLYITALLALWYAHRAYRQGLKKVRERYPGDDPPALPPFPALIRRIFLIAMVVIVGGWFLQEALHLLAHPEIVGTMPYRGANQGIVPLAYETVVSLLLFVVFVDLGTVVAASVLLPWFVADDLVVDALSPDGAGGFSEVAKMPAMTTSAFLVTVAVGTVSRFSTTPFFLVLAALAWLLGIAGLIASQYPLNRRLAEHKEQELRRLAEELEELPPRSTSDAETVLTRLELYRCRDEVRNMATRAITGWNATRAGSVASLTLFSVLRLVPFEAVPNILQILSAV